MPIGEQPQTSLAYSAPGAASSPEPPVGMTKEERGDAQNAAARKQDKVDRRPFEERSVEELREWARKMESRGRASMSKDALVAACGSTPNSNRLRRGCDTALAWRPTPPPAAARSCAAPGHGHRSRKATITDQEMTGVAGRPRAALGRYRLATSAPRTALGFQSRWQ
jgi:hypothetical protein